jgi:hypothetical protein
MLEPRSTPWAGVLVVPAAESAAKLKKINGELRLRRFFLCFICNTWNCCVTSGKKNAFFWFFSHTAIKKSTTKITNTNKQNKQIAYDNSSKKMHLLQETKTRNKIYQS